MTHTASQHISPNPRSTTARGTAVRRSVPGLAFAGVVALALSVPAVLLPATAHQAAAQEVDRDAAPAVRPVPGHAPTAPGRHPAAVGAEQAFFAAFNQGAMPAEDVLTPLMGAYASDPSDPRTNLLLGLTHLWIAAESDRQSPRVIENVMLSERFLQRAQELAPGDQRIPSWLVPMQLSMASIERRAGDREAMIAGLYAAYEDDPVFHSFTVALLGWDSPNGSPAFDAGLEALRAARDFECGDDPSCHNVGRWPHNLEGFRSFVVDYELRAGNVAEAREVLSELQAEPSYASWPFRHRTEARLADFDDHAARFADDDPANDPPTSVKIDACAACHAAR